MADHITGSVSIVGTAVFKIDRRNIQPTVIIFNPKQASTNSYVLHRNSEVEINTSKTHIEIETRQPEIKVIDID